MLLLASSLLLIQLPVVQTYLTQQVAAKLSKELNTYVSVQAVDIDFFNSLVLEGLYVEDQQGDTLIHAEYLVANISTIDIENKYLQVNELELASARFYLKVLQGDSTNNMDFLLKYFMPEKSRSKEQWLFDFQNLKILNSAFSFHNHNQAKKNLEESIDFYHLELQDINGNFNSTILVNDSVYTEIENLSFKESSGFSLTSLSSNASFTSQQVLLDKLIIESPNSAIYTDFSMRVKDYSDFNNFMEKVQLSADFSSSKLHMKDLSYFISELNGLNLPIGISGKINGSVSNLSGKKMKLHFLDKSYFYGDFDIRGLPLLEETSIYLNVVELKSTASDMEKIPLPPFTEKQYLKLPENFYKLGEIYFTGNFAGFYNDLVAYGNFYTDLGNLKTDISLKEKNAVFKYKGNVASKGFHLGKFMDINHLSRISMDMQVDGNGFDRNNIEISVDGKVNKLGVDRYTYKNIDVKGKLANKKFSGDLKLNDPNLVMDFSGRIDLSGEKPISQFKINVEKAMLGNLKLFHEKDSLTNFTFAADFDLVGYKLDEIEGELNISDIQYLDRKRNYSFEKIELKALQDSENKQLFLNSSLIDVSVEGNFQLRDLDASIKEFANIYIPSMEYEVDEDLENELKFNVYLKNTKALSDIFLPQLKVDSGSHISGAFSTLNKHLSLKGNVPHFSYSNIDFYNVGINGKNNTDSLELGFEIGSVHFVDSPALKSVQIDLISFYNTLLTSIHWDNQSSKVNAANINLETAFNGFNNFSMVFYDSYMTILDTTWSIRENNEVQYFEDKINFFGLELLSETQSISIDGGLAHDSTTTLLIDLHQMDLNYISEFIPKSLVRLKGKANGRAEITQYYTSPITTVDLQLNKLLVNNMEVGESNLQSRWHSQNKELSISAGFGSLDSNILTVSGSVYPYEEIDILDLKIEVDSLPLKMLDRYIDEYLSEISGSASGTLNVKGNYKNPLLSGNFDLDSARMKVNYLNTIYTINDAFFVENDFIGFNLIKIVDEKGNVGIATGTIFHDRYTDFNLDIGLEVNKFMALNTSAADNDIYYGRAIVSGMANITGFADQLIFDINISTDKGTDFFIPLDQGSEVDKSNFLTFTNSGNNEQLINNYNVDLSGIQLNFDLQVTPDANVSLVFDEQIGDVMRARGAGNLKLEINTLGNFNMFGQYVIQDGDYLFTLQNVVNKRFVIEKGGRISWNGDPYGANIDMSAIYSLRASLYDILVDTTGTYKRRIPVDLKLMMSGKLLNPEIEFDIDITTADDMARQALQSILYVNSNEVNRQEMNQQVFGLLVMNRFLPPSGAGQVNEDYQRTNLGAQSSSEFLSNQLSNWLSRLSDDVDIGIRYRPGDELSSDEVEVELSTELLNDRILLDGNFGYSNNEYNLNNQNNSGLIGEFSIEYKMSEDGRFRIRGFNRSNNNSLLRTNSPYTQGFGVFYREEFEHVGELWRKWWNKSSAIKEDEESNLKK